MCLKIFELLDAFQPLSSTTSVVDNIPDQVQEEEVSVQLMQVVTAQEFQAYKEEIKSELQSE